jgi:hypothetical protein
LAFRGTYRENDGDAGNALLLGAHERRRGQHRSRQHGHEVAAPHAVSFGLPADTLSCRLHEAGKV